jgi:hypothetical protein
MIKFFKKTTAREYFQFHIYAWNHIGIYISIFGYGFHIRGTIHKEGRYLEDD